MTNPITSRHIGWIGYGLMISSVAIVLMRRWGIVDPGVAPVVRVLIPAGCVLVIRSKGYPWLLSASGLIPYLGILLAVLLPVREVDEGKELRHRGGFFDFVRNRAYARSQDLAFAKLQADMDRFKAEGKADRETVAALTAALVDDSAFYGTPAKKLHILAEKHPASMRPLIADALAWFQAQTKSPAGSEGEGSEQEDEGYDILAGLAALLDCRESIPLLMIDARTDGGTRRVPALRALGRMAADEAIGLLSAAMERERTETFKTVSQSVAVGIKAGKASPRYKEAMLPKIRLAVPNASMETLEALVSALVAIDAKAAFEFLTTETLLVPTFPGSREIIATLEAEGVPVPAERLLRYIEDARTANTRISAKSALAAIKVLVDRGDSRAADLPTPYLDHPVGLIRERAARIILSREGIPDPVSEMVKRRAAGPDGWPTIFRQQYALWWLECQTDNGGVTQFFLNGGGIWFKDALEGAREFGMHDLDERLERLSALIAPKGLPADIEKQRDLLAKAHAKFEEEFAAFDTAFYNNAERREILIFKHKLAHADEIKRLVAELPPVPPEAP